MSDPREALAVYERYVQNERPVAAGEKTILAAARRWAEFPTDEDVEDAAAEEVAYEGRLWMDLGGAEKQYRRDKMRAALSAVRARETGETE